MADREKEVIVTNDGGGGGGTIIAVVLVIAVVVVLFLLFGRGLLNGAGTQDIKADIKVDTPATNK
jgi:FlaG/FlaF family flagellin (archaellin)